MNLTGTLVAVGIMGVVAAGVAKVMGDGLGGQAHLDLRADRAAVKLMLIEATSCADTLPAGTCTPGSLLELKRKLPNGNFRVLVAKTGTGTRYGKWTARAECAPSGAGIVVRLARPSVGTTLTETSASKFEADPLTKARYAWNDDKALLFPTNVELCSAGSGGGAGSFGGLYWIGSPPGNVCLRPNPLTGACNCPSGATAALMYPDPGGTRMFLCH